MRQNNRLVKSALAIFLLLGACTVQLDEKLLPAKLDTDELTSITASDIFSTVTTALKTAADKGSVKLTTATRTALAPSFGKLADPNDYCLADGGPMEGGVQLNNGSPGALPRGMYCLLNQSSDGPDTVQGAITQARGFVCSVGRLAFDGNTYDRTVTVSTDCFNKNFVTMANDMGIDQVAVQVIGSEPPAFGNKEKWDRSLVIKSVELKMTLEILLKSSERGVL